MAAEKFVNTSTSDNKSSPGLRALSQQEVAAALESLPGWSVIGGKLYRKLEFADFSRAFGFMASVAVHAEAMCHHPEWSNVYNRVEVWLVTHDVGGISALDFELGRRINELFAR